ncbi:MAG: hypothetical protein NC114_06795 [Ruminococcus flavefaciens]|nr:hypothetical protein [Ruminococcus flavefaciens]
MSKQTIKIETELCTRIEALHLETEARRQVVVGCIDSGMDQNSENFKKYHQTYMEFFTLYQHAKRELEETYIHPVTGSNSGARWNLQYSTAEVTIEFPGDKK